jgi:hypothetical protein
MKTINLVLAILISAQQFSLAIDVEASSTKGFKASQSKISQLVAQSKTPTSALKYIRPKTADNGSPFPKKSGYIKGYPIQFKAGYSTLTVNNSKNSSDVFVKLYALDAMPPQPVRVFFIRKGDKFTADNIKSGNYDIRYRDLNYGGLSRTDTFNIAEPMTFEGATRYKRMVLTLYKVTGGNMKTYPLSEQEF